MYIEAMNSSAAVGAAAGTSAAVSVSSASKPVSTAKPVIQSDADNTVRVETTEGENTLVQENGNQSCKTNRNDTRTAEEKKSAEHEKIKKAIGKMNAQLPNSEVKFGIHDKTDRVTIKLIDRETKEVIREFPPEKTLDMIAKCMELAGVLMDCLLYTSPSPRD